ncbi:MAG: hypothetical protein QME87_09945 [Bacillota bacterium]|nr:hypothetical protein [Bacillota bacterium]
MADRERVERVIRALVEPLRRRYPCLAGLRAQLLEDMLQELDLMERAVRDGNAVLAVLHLVALAENVEFARDLYWKKGSAWRELGTPPALREAAVYLVDLLREGDRWRSRVAEVGLLC